MKKNKNIEKLFQEKFENFEVSPPSFVWENIKEKLEPKEKKRRVIPFWFKTAGIAASLVTVVSVVFYTTTNDFKISNSNSVVNSETTTTNNNGNQNVVDTNTSNTSESLSTNNTANSSVTKASENTSNSIVNTNSTPNVSDSKTNSKFNNGVFQNSKLNNSNNSYVLNRKKETNQKRFNKNKASFGVANSESIAHKNNISKTNSSLKSNSEFNEFHSSKTNTTTFGITDLNTFNSTPKKTTNAEITDFKSVSTTSSTTTLKSTDEINGILAENNTENSTTSTGSVAVEEIKIDTTTLAKVTIEENPMEKLLREKETNKVADEKEKWSKWAVNSFVSPIFFNSFANGSPLSEEFATNKKTFNNSTSYGVGVAYHLNKRLAIKTGISNLNLDYDTENIAFYSSFEDQSQIANTNIQRNANSKYLVLKNEKNITKNEVENQVIPSNENFGNLNQKTQYIEVPLEMSYALLNKKIGVTIRGGMSTLFLTENAISIQATDGNMQIGKASNLNNVHFSSNVGLGLSYNFMKNFQLNVEPTLKYQINTFNKNATDFTPYVIGVNTGVSYKF